MVVYFSEKGDTVFYEVQPDIITPRNGDIFTITTDPSLTGMCDADWVMDRIEKDYKIDTTEGYFEDWTDPPDCGWHPMTDRLVIQNKKVLFQR